MVMYIGLATIMAVILLGSAFLAPSLAYATQDNNSAKNVQKNHGKEVKETKDKDRKDKDRKDKDTKDKDNDHDKNCVSEKYEKVCKKKDVETSDNEIPSKDNKNQSKVNEKQSKVNEKQNNDYEIPSK